MKKPSISSQDGLSSERTTRGSAKAISEKIEMRAERAEAELVDDVAAVAGQFGAGRLERPERHHDDGEQQRGDRRRDAVARERCR